MTTTWFCSDLHWGHKNIGKFRTPLVSSERENRHRIKQEWKNLVNKKDDVYIVGDFCFDMEILPEILDMPGHKKYLVRGNHDTFDLGCYSKYFTNIYGLLKYKEFWVSHAPIHPCELRGKKNLHGHVHHASVRKSTNSVDDELDNRYLNLCPENLWPTFGSCLISIDMIRKYFNK